MSDDDIDDAIGTTKLSSRGQVVIPEKFRVALKLKTGQSFQVSTCTDLETDVVQILLTPLKAIKCNRCGNSVARE